MFEFYDLKILPIIMETFKVNEIIMGGLSDKEIISEILDYCNSSNASYIAIDHDERFPEHYINGYTINILPQLDNYDAIFLNDDPNWFTVYNELNIIKNNNKEFPLVFICNNIFPHKRRDSYINPEIIPKEFLNEYSKELKLNDESYINDNFFHAIRENTPKNGVLTAIEDFLTENDSVSIMDIHLLNGITILYSSNNINKIRIGNIKEKIGNHSLDETEIYSELTENQSIQNYISLGNISNMSSKSTQMEFEKSKNIIKNYEDEIKHKQNELNYKNSQITSLDSKLSLKDSKIKNLESKLTNKENEISKFDSDFKNVDLQITSLNNELELNKKNFKNNEEKLKNEIESNRFIITSLKKEIFKKEAKEQELTGEIKKNSEEIQKNNEKINNLNNILSDTNEKLNDKELLLDSLKKQYTSQFSKLDNKEYCINCLKEENQNNRLEIQFLKKNYFTKKVLSPVGYFYLIIKSNLKDLPLNLKLYRALKNSDCFDIGYYLSKNEDLQESRWCNYFSPELHYVCNGFNEKREFNKKYYNTHSKRELLEYILNCKK